jgi:hypothetical protein
VVGAPAQGELYGGIVGVGAWKRTAAGGAGSAHARCRWRGST